MLNNGLFQEMPGMREVEQVTEHKRLTTKEKHPHGAEGVSKDKLTGKYCRGVFEATACVEKLAEYENAEEEGRLVVLPCKVGDTVWMVHQRLTSTVNNVISKMTVTELRGNRLNPIWFVIDGEYGRTSFHPSEIGKTVFLTREEAEKELREMEGKS